MLKAFFLGGALAAVFILMFSFMGAPSAPHLQDCLFLRRSKSGGPVMLLRLPPPPTHAIVSASQAQLVCCFRTWLTLTLSVPARQVYSGAWLLCCSPTSES